jgi:branched-chain amino acid transport system permease protein
MIGALAYQTSYRGDMRLVKTWVMRVWLFVLFAFALVFPISLNDGETQLADGFQVYLACTALVAITGAVALNLLTGYTGQISLGNAAFLAIGALAAHVFGMRFHLPFVLVVPLALVTGLVVGAVVGLPSLRVRGLYLLLATMALHFIVNYVFLQYQLAAAGVSGLQFPHPNVAGFVLKADRQWYYLFLAAAVGTCLFVKNLTRHAEGRALVAVRDQDVAAMILGVNVARSKVVAFAVSSGIICALGALLAYWQGNVTNENFPLSLAIDYTVMIIIGGLGSVTGAILGAFFVTLLPTVIQQFVQGAANTLPALSAFTGAKGAIFNTIVYGLLIILFLILKPAGLAGIWADIKRFFTRWPYSY